MTASRSPGRPRLGCSRESPAQGIFVPSHRPKPEVPIASHCLQDMGIPVRFPETAHGSNGQLLDMPIRSAQRRPISTVLSGATASAPSTRSAADVQKMRCSWASGGGARMLDPETPIQGGYRSLGCERRPDVHPRHLRPRLSSSLSTKRGMLASLLLLSSTSGPCKVSSPLRWRAPSPTCAIGGIARVTPVCTPSTQYSAQGARTQTRSGQPGKETISKVHVSRLHFGISVAGMFASSGRRYRPSLTEIPSLAGFSGERRTKMRAKRRNIEKGSQYPLQCPDLLALGFRVLWGC